MVKYLNSTWAFDLYLRQINIAHLNINQVLPVRYLEHLVFTTMKTTLANYTQIQSQVLSTYDSLTKFFDSLENGHKK